MGFIDIHCHILPGLDDGPEKIEESLEMLRVAEADGTTHIFATPHISEGTYDNNRANIIDSLSELKKRTEARISLFHGADARISLDIIKKVEDRTIPTLNDTGFLLMEFPHFSVPPNAENLIYNMRHRDITPIITHPERHPVFISNLKQIKRMREVGALCQITAMSITGEFGPDVRAAAISMIREGLVDFVASDAHDSKRRPPVLSKAYDELKKKFGVSTADALLINNPGRITGETI